MPSSRVSGVSEPRAIWLVPEPIVDAVVRPAGSPPTPGKASRTASAISAGKLIEATRRIMVPPVNAAKGGLTERILGANAVVVQGASGPIVAPKGLRGVYARFISLHHRCLGTTMASLDRG